MPKIYSSCCVATDRKSAIFFFQDALVVFAYSGLWLFSSLLNTGFAASSGSVLLGLTAVSFEVSSGAT